MRTIDRRQVLRSLGVAAAGLAAGPRTWAGQPPAPGKRPNIVLIVADDLGWNNVGYHGGAARTPNIDRLAREGVELDRFYVAPLCSPTRAGLMTGRHPLRFGVGCTVITPQCVRAVPLDERMIPEVLAGAGYRRRGCFGKWHLGHSDLAHHPLRRDVLPTLMRIAGVKDHHGQPLDGRDVLDQMTGLAQPIDRPWFSYIGYGAKDRLAVQEGPWKLLYAGPRILQTKDLLADGEVHLFRILEDPNEKNDLAEANGDVVRRLLAKLKTYRSWHGKTCLLDETAIRKDFRAPKDWILPGTGPEELGR